MFSVTPIASPVTSQSDTNCPLFIVLRIICTDYSGLGTIINYYGHP